MASELVVGYTSDMSIWTVMSVPVAVLLLEDLSLVLPPCPQARALLMGQLMMQLNIVIALIVRTWHFWSAKIVAHFMSLALTSPVARVVFAEALESISEFSLPCLVRLVVALNHFPYIWIDSKPNFKG
jgi:hypothetical protein